MVNGGLSSKCAKSLMPRRTGARRYPPAGIARERVYRLWLICSGV